MLNYIGKKEKKQMKEENIPYTIPLEKRMRIIVDIQKRYSTTSKYKDYSFYTGKRPQIGDAICRMNLMHHENPMFYLADGRDVENTGNWDFVMVRINKSSDETTDLVVSVGNEEIKRTRISDNRRKIIFKLINSEFIYDVLYGRVYIPILSIAHGSRLNSKVEGVHTISKVEPEDILSIHSRLLMLLNEDDIAILVYGEKLYCIPVKELRTLATTDGTDVKIGSIASFYLSDISKFEEPPF